MYRLLSQPNVAGIKKAKDGRLVEVGGRERDICPRRIENECEGSETNC